MIELFDSLPQYESGVIRIQQFVYVKEGLLKNIDRVRTYYHDTRFNVNNDHVIVKLINSLNVSTRREFVNYLDVASDNALNVARVMGFTSSTFYGRVFKNGPFYGDGVSEILIIDDTIPITLKETSDWKMLEPIRVLRHPFTDMSFDLPDGTYNGSNEGGIAVISINAATLMAMYRGWLQSGRGSVDNPESISQFVRMYCLTNMLTSHMDIALFNRLDGIFRGQALAPFRNVHPFTLIDYTSRVDEVLSRYVDVMKTHHEPFEQQLKHMPVITAESMGQAMMLPKVLQLRQVKWALILARMPLIRFLMKMNAESKNQRNVGYVNRIYRSLREIRNDRTVENLVGREIFEDFKSGVGIDIQPGTDYWSD